MAQGPAATITVAEKWHPYILIDPKAKACPSLTTNESIGYLVTVFTEHDAVIGYLHHTRKSEIKKKMLLDLIQKGDETLLKEYKNIDVLVLSPAENEQISRYSFFCPMERIIS